MKIHSLKNWLFLLGVLFAIPTLYAQSSRPIFEHLTTDFGLSSNKIEAILQDDEGFYWIASQNGLNRFDGTNFRIYTHNPDDTTSLTHNNCTAIAKDKAGDIWVATHHGVSRLRKKSGTFQRIFFQNPIRNHELANRIYHLSVDTTGNVWIAGNGLWQYNTKTNTIQLFQSNNNEKLAYKVITQLQYDTIHHGLWMSTGHGVVFFDIATSQFYDSDYNPYGWKLFDLSRHNEFTLDHIDRIWFRDHQSQCIASFDIGKNEVLITPFKITSGIRQLQTDEQNRIWIFYWVERTVILNPASMIMDSTFFTKSNERSVLSEKATSLYIDHQHNYWIASSTGISIYREANQYYRLHQPKPVSHQSGVETMNIQALAQSDPSSLWIGTVDGLYTYDLQSGQTQKVPIPNTAPGVTTLLTNDERLWVGAHDMLSSIDVKNHLVIKQVILEPGIIFIREDVHEHLWVGLWLDGLFHLESDGKILRHYLFDAENLHGIASNNLISALTDADRLWIGYNAGLGFSSFDSASDTWNHFHPVDGNSMSNMLSNAGTVTVITKGEMNNLWIGTHGGGVFYANPTEKTYEHLSQASGLNSNYINSILTDRIGHYWIATADGMNIIDSATHTIRSLDMNLTFRDNDFRQNGLTGLNGNLYFFFNDKVIEIYPKLYDVMGVPQRMVISSFTVFDNERQLPDTNKPIVLSHDENFFSFGFSVIKTHPLQKVQYAYRIDGFDKDWIFTDRPFANYTNVRYGRYAFQAKAMKETGQWSEPLISLPLIIHPPFWETWWFMLLIVLFVTASVYGLYHYRIQQLKTMMAVRAKISRDLHDEVGSALSSIHVYSSVAEKSMEKNLQVTRDALKVIHDNSRQVMENMSDIVWAINSADQGGLSLEKKIKNYGFELLTPQNIVTRYAIDAHAEHLLQNMEARKNVLLIAKEAMNNIARYSKATEVAVLLKLVNQHLELTISDNGIGFDTMSGQKGNGLSNMKKRTEALGGKFSILSTNALGTEITCALPIASIRER